MDALQIDFFKRIKNTIPPQISLVNELAELLEVSNDSAYRRIRGETDLSLSEYLKVSDYFKLQLENVEQGETIPFNYKLIDNSEISLIKYLASINDDIKTIERFEKKEIIYAAKDIPIFHHFAFPELASFKIFFWLKSIINCADYENEKFSSDKITNDEIELGKQILKSYLKIPASEIWTEETLNSTLKQIEYYWESGFFIHKKDAFLLCDQVLEMIMHVKQQAEKGYKFIKGDNAELGSFNLYFSEVMIGNNNILVRMGDTMATYLTHNTLNYLITRNEAFCNETDLSLKNLIKKSTLISGVSEKQRNRFFRRAEENIVALKRKIESD